MLSIRTGCMMGFVWLAASACAWGQEPAAALGDPVLDALHEQSSQFLEGVSLGRTENAFTELLRGSPLARESDAVTKLTAAARALESRFGKFRDFERIETKRIGKDLVLMKYLYKCEDYPVVWYFTYYRDLKQSEAPAANTPWNVIAVRFDTDLELLGF